MKRIRRTNEAWRELIRQQEQSGMSPAAFCEQQGLSIKTFYRRRKALRPAQTERSQRFIQVKSGSRPVSVSPSQELSLHYQTLKLQFSSSVDACWVATLMKALS